MASKTVRAKFKVASFEVQEYNRAGKTSDGQPDYRNSTTVEIRTVKLAPVYGNGDPEHENTKFWQASPSGRIELGTINPAAWEHFELGKSYYVDFTLAE